MSRHQIKKLQQKLLKFRFGDHIQLKYIFFEQYLCPLIEQHKMQQASSQYLERELLAQLGQNMK